MPVFDKASTLIDLIHDILDYAKDETTQAHIHRILSILEEILLLALALLRKS